MYCKELANKYTYESNKYNMNQANTNMNQANVLQGTGQQAMAESRALPLSAPLPVELWSQICIIFIISY